MVPRPTIYFAAAMFNSREIQFNSNLADRISYGSGCRVILPQRDGLEFTNLMKKLEGNLQQEDIMPAIQNMIYSLDIGYLIPNSDLILGILDEPLDDGMIVELCYGKRLGKKIIGLRTDNRTPFGSDIAHLRGIHPFPAYQCDIFIGHSPKIVGAGKELSDLEAIANKVNEAIAILEPEIQYGTNIPPIEDKYLLQVINNANLLFQGIDPFGVKNSIEQITERYIANRQELEKQTPLLR